MNRKINIEEMDTRYYLFGFLFSLNNKLQKIGDKFYEEITVKQFFLLACMHLFEDKSPSLLEISQVMGCSHQNAKAIAEKLREKEFIDIIVDSEDKRKKLLKLTKKAEKLSSEHKEEETKFIDRLFKGIEHNQLENALKTLIKMEENLDEISSNL